MQQPYVRFNISPEQWDQAKLEVRSAVLEAARSRRTTTYTDVANEITFRSVNPRELLLAALLGEIFTEEHSAGRPALTALVVHKGGDGRPGPGFYEQAKALGYRFIDKEAFWSAQRDEAFRVYGSA